MQFAVATELPRAQLSAQLLTGLRVQIDPATLFKQKLLPRFLDLFQLGEDAGLGDDAGL